MDKLKTLRENKAISMRDLAALAGVSPTTIIRIENGVNKAPVRWVTRRKIAKALGVPPSDIDWT